MIIKNLSRIKDNSYGGYLCALGLLVMAAFACSVFLWQAETPAASGDAISGQVLDEHGPVAGANVRIQGDKKTVLTDKSGNFLLSGLPVGAKVNISAWKDGYYCALQENVTHPKKGIQLKLIRYQLGDNKAYEWLPPEGIKNACVDCHNPAIIAMSLQDPHLKAAANPRFLTMYYGTDTQGNQSSRTRYDKGRGVWKHLVVPWPPDPAQPYYGPGYQLDFPGTTGNCTACHIPGAALSRPVDPRTVKGADKYGVHCDFCHKIADTKMDPVTRMPFLRFPGVHSLDIRRPFTNDKERPQLFFGTFADDNVPTEDTNLPLLRESQYCAPCHYGVFWSTVVYNSYGEWLKSPYADPKSGKAKTCQECHMPSPTIYKGKAITNVAPGKGGIERDPAAIHNHNMTVDTELLRNSLTMDASARMQNGKVVVDVTLTNDKTGHHIPTDSPLRHLILLVEAKDSRGRVLKQVVGPKLPEWCGVGKAKKGHYGGLPGKAYAKLLKEKWTEVFPTGAYWNHTELVSDNRLAAFATDASTYAFTPPADGGKAAITVTLLHRRAFINLMEQKKWDVPDIVMARRQFLF